MYVLTFMCFGFAQAEMFEGEYARLRQICNLTSPIIYLGPPDVLKQDPSCVLRAEVRSSLHAVLRNKVALRPNVCRSKHM